MIDLMLKQSIIATFVELLYQPDEHVSDIARAGDPDDHQRRRERQPVRIRVVVNGAQVKRTRFRGKLFDLDLGNAGEGLGWAALSLAVRRIPAV